jgi:hypothetical protein
MERSGADEAEWIGERRNAAGVMRLIVHLWWIWFKHGLNMV